MMPAIRCEPTLDLGPQFMDVHFAGIDQNVRAAAQRRQHLLFYLDPDGWPIGRGHRMPATRFGVSPQKNVGRTVEVDDLDHGVGHIPQHFYRFKDSIGRVSPIARVNSQRQRALLRHVVEQGWQQADRQIVYRLETGIFEHIKRGRPPGARGASDNNDAAVA